MKKVLITGFDPFDGETINPAWEAVKQIDETMEGISIVKLQIPTAFKKAGQRVIEKIEEENPDVVICVGQAGGNYQIDVERVAINIADARIADNDGYQPMDEAIQTEGENAYFSSFPVRKIVEAIKAVGTPAGVSNTAGTYVCNYVLYSLLHYIQNSGKDIKGGFIHVPYLPEQVLSKANTPSMDLSRIIKSLEAAVRACVD